MKTAQDIIHHRLYNTSTFKQLKQKAIIALFFEELFPSLVSKILFVKIKENTLQIALKHPAYKKEFNYIQDTIKSTLKATASTRFDGLEHITDIVTFVSYYAIPKEENTTLTNHQYYYYEHAQGNFTNKATSPRVFQLFEDIRENILKYHRLKDCIGQDDYYRRINS